MEGRKEGECTRTRKQQPFTSLFTFKLFIWNRTVRLIKNVLSWYWRTLSYLTYIYFVQPSFSSPLTFSNIHLFRPTFLFCTSDLLKHIFISSNFPFLHLHPSQTYIYFVLPSFSAPPPFSNIYIFRPTFLFCTSDLLKHIFISSNLPFLHLHPSQTYIYFVQLSFTAPPTFSNFIARDHLWNYCVLYHLMPIHGELFYRRARKT